ncbi:hypothetical protein ACFIOY_24130 [Bradyrhizobium sp. TZ2]|jgi:hypothetical protein
MALLLLGPVLAGCNSASDLLSKDADWFSRSGRVFIRNVSIETPPLSPTKPVTPDELVSADGGCPGMAAPGADANALADGAAGNPPPSTTGTVALGHTECDVVRGIGAPDNVNFSNNARGDRVAVVNYSRGQRAGIYTFTAGRLTSIERAPEPVAQPRGAKPKKKPAA